MTTLEFRAPPLANSAKLTTILVLHMRNFSQPLSHDKKVAETIFLLPIFREIMPERARKGYVIGGLSNKY